MMARGGCPRIAFLNLSPGVTPRKGAWIMMQAWAQTAFLTLVQRCVTDVQYRYSIGETLPEQ